MDTPQFQFVWPHNTHTFNTPLVVAEGLTTEAILGLDFFEMNTCALDMESRLLSTTVPLSAVLPGEVDKKAQVYMKATSCWMLTWLQYCGHFLNARV